MMKPSGRAVTVVLRLFIASFFLALPSIAAQESQAIVPVSCAAGGVCHVGDIGPAGGTVYYVSSGSSTFSCGPTRSNSCNTLEYFQDFGDGPIGSPFMNSSYPDTPTSSAGTDFETINFTSGPTADLGYGLVNTLSYYTQLNSLRGVTCAGSTYGPGAVTLAVCYSATSSTPPYIWALPSPGEAYMLYKYLKNVTTDTNYNIGSPSVGCTPAVGNTNTQILNNCFWTSLQSNRSVAVIDLTTGTFAFQPKLRVSGIGMNGMYKVIPVHAFLSTVADAAPTIASATISGTVKVGQVLTATANTVTGSPTPTASYEWKAGGSVVGTNSANYTIASGDLGKTITVKITVANNVSPSATVTSNPTAPVAVADSAPGITSATISGIVKVGEVLTATANGVTGSPSPTASYEWKAGTTVVGSNSANYTIASGDLGKTITVIITESNGVGSNATATSSPTISVSSSTTSIGSGGDGLISLAANSSTNLNSVKLTGPGQALRITGYTDTSTIKVVVTSQFGKIGISVTSGLSLPTSYQTLLSESATTIAFSGTKANLNAALNSLSYFAPAAAGSGDVVFTVTSDGYEPTLTRSLTIGVKKSQAALSITNTDLIASIGDTVTVIAVGGSSSGVISYSTTRVGGGEGCVIDTNTGVLTTDLDTNCLVVATRAGDASYSPVTSNTVEFEFNPINQPTPIVITYDKLVISSLTETITLGATGGDGTGAYSFATQSDACTINLNVISPSQNVGRCDVIATRAPSGRYAIATSQWATTFFVNIPTHIASDSFTVIAPSDLLAGDSLILSTTLTPTGSEYESSMKFKVTGNNCSYNESEHKISTAKAAYCTVIAYWAPTAIYSYQQSPQVTISFNLRTPASLTIPNTYTPVLGVPLTITATGGNPDTSTVSYRVSGAGCSDYSPANNGKSVILLVTQPAYCSVIASQPSDGKYKNIESASKTFAFGLKASETLTITNNASTYLAKTPVSLSSSGGNGGAVTYSLSGTVGSCVLNGVSLSSNKPGLCLVNASQAVNGYFGSTISATKAFYFNKISAPALSLPTSESATAGQALALLATGGIPDSETPTTSFLVSGANCGNPSPVGRSLTLSPTTATACTVTVSQSSTDTYNPPATATRTYIFGFGASPALTIPETYTGFAGVALLITATGGNPDTSTVTYRVVGTGCGDATVSNNGRSITLQPAGVAYCSVIASQAPAGRYGYVSSSSRTIAFNLQPSPALTIDDTDTARAIAGVDWTFRARGGNGSAISYTVSGTGCSNTTSNSDLTIRTIKIAYCTITARQSATSLFSYAQSAAKTVKFDASDFSGDLLVTNIETATAAIALTLTNNGGAYASQVNYIATPASTCVVNNTDKTLTTTGEAYCSVLAYWPSGSVYKYKLSPSSKLIYFQTLPQSQFSISNISTSVVKGNEIIVTTRGGSGNGQVSYSKKESTCSITANANGTATIVANVASTCSVTATKAASGKYARSVSQTVIFTFRNS